MIYFVYAIYNCENDKIYIGQTKNLQERLDLHNNKAFNNSYTSRLDGKWLLVYKEEFQTRQEALRRESQLKSYRGRQYIRQFIPT